MSNTRLLLQDVFVGEIAKSYTTAAITLDSSIGFACVFKKTNVTLTNKTFTSATLSAISITAHGYQTGLKVRFTTTGALPTGLAVLTDYYLIRVSADVIMAASTQENAIAGNFIVLSGGSGTHTVSVQAATPFYFYLEGSIDNDTWVKLPDSVYEITDVAQMIEHEVAFYHSVRVVIDLSSGQFNLNSKIMLKGF